MTHHAVQLTAQQEHDGKCSILMWPIWTNWTFLIKHTRQTLRLSLLSLVIRLLVKWHQMLLIQQTWPDVVLMSESCGFFFLSCAALCNALIASMVRFSYQYNNVATLMMAYMQQTYGLLLLKLHWHFLFKLISHWRVVQNTLVQVGDILVIITLYIYNMHFFIVLLSKQQ